MHVLILGCGYIGMELGKHLLQLNHQVTGVVQSHSSAENLKTIGITPIIADCTTREGAIKACQPKADSVVFLISSRGGNYQKTYFESMSHILNALKHSPPRLFIYTSSTSVYAQTTGEWVTEKSSTAPPHENGKILLNTEKLLAEIPQGLFPVVILRLSGIYGPGQHSLLDDLKTGALTLPGDGTRWMNQIHREDVVKAIIHLLNSNISLSQFNLFNLTDNLPIQQRDYVEWICKEIKRPMPKFDTTIPPKETRGRKGFQPNRRISNATLRQLGWTPSYPTYQEGIQSLLQSIKKNRKSS